MKIDGNNIRPGNVIEHNGGLWRAIKIAHTQPGKGGAYLQVELKNLRTDQKLNERFRSSEKVERAILEQKDFQFLFEADDMYTFMDTTTYDQIALSSEDIGEHVAFLQDGMQVNIEFYEETPLGVALPEKITLEIAETEAVIKGQTAAGGYKPAILENGIRIGVPQFVKVGDRVVVSTENREYVSRAD